MIRAKRGRQAAPHGRQGQPRGEARPARPTVPARDRRVPYKLVVVKPNGEFVWHKHDNTDNFCLVPKGHPDDPAARPRRGSRTAMRASASIRSTGPNVVRSGPRGWSLKCSLAFGCRSDVATDLGFAPRGRAPRARPAVPSLCALARTRAVRADSIGCSSRPVALSEACRLSISRRAAQPGQASTRGSRATSLPLQPCAAVPLSPLLRASRESTFRRPLRTRIKQGGPASSDDCFARAKQACAPDGPATGGDCSDAGKMQL